jgi:putative solute:sodium symporter small subunit
MADLADRCLTCARPIPYIADVTDPDPPAEERESRYWRANLRLLAILLAVWFAASFGLGILFVERLNEIQVAGFPLGFWFAQQGSIYVFIVLIWVYAHRMDRIDREHGVD